VSKLILVANTTSNLNPDLYLAGPLVEYRPKVLSFVASIQAVVCCEQFWGAFWGDVRCIPKNFVEKKSTKVCK